MKCILYAVKLSVTLAVTVSNSYYHFQIQTFFSKYDILLVASCLNTYLTHKLVD